MSTSSTLLKLLCIGLGLSVSNSFKLVSSTSDISETFMTGRIRTLIADTLGEKPTSTPLHYFEHQESGKIHPISIPDSMKLKPGSVVKVKGSIDGGILKTSSIELLHHGSMEGLQLRLPPNGIKALVINPVFSACSTKSTGDYTAAQLSATLFESSNPTGNSLGLNLRSCSKGKQIIDDKNSRVVSIQIKPANCNGTSYKWNNCELDGYGFAEEMRTLLKASNPGIVWDDYSSHWFLLPSSMDCWFAGLGTLGGDYVWIPNLKNLADYVPLWAHELGHNLGMHHSAAQTSKGEYDEYGDRTGIMGSGEACFNLANRETASWEKPAITINASSLAIGKWTNYTIKSSDLYLNVGLKINTFFKTDMGNSSVYIEFRRAGQLWKDFVRNETVRAGGDVALSSDFQGTTMYVYPSPIPSGAPSLTYFAGNALPVSGSTASEKRFTGIHVRVNQNITSKTDTLRISVCRCRVNQAAAQCCSFSTVRTAASVSPAIIGGATVGGVAIVGVAAGIIIYRRRQGGVSTLNMKPKNTGLDSVQI